MPDDKTTVTELATALGLTGHNSVADAVATRPESVQIGVGTWDRLSDLLESHRFSKEFDSSFENGRIFLESREGLRGRVPALVEWTGGRRPPGDEVAPIDLQIDHVYLISCKYRSANITNTSPTRIFDGLLSIGGERQRIDWYEALAPVQYQVLYDECRHALGVADLPDLASQMTPTERRLLRQALPGRGRYPTASAQEAYRDLIREVSAASAKRWTESLTRIAPETMLWRLLRIGNAPYFILGADPTRPLQLRVMSPWDWRRRYRLTSFSVAAANVGQPQVDWAATYRTDTGATHTVRGHVEIRWSHGPFQGAPEAKVYLDTPHHEVPGYVSLGDTPSTGAVGRLF